MHSQNTKSRASLTGPLGWIGSLLQRIPFRRKSASTADEVKKKRRNIAITAIAIGAIAGFIELPMPVDDAFRAVRAELRSHDAPDDIVVVAVDDATLNEIGRDLPTRIQDAEVVEKIFAAGATKLVFDRAYADPATPEEDAALARTFARHKGKVWLGASPAADNGLQKHDGLFPTTKLRHNVEMASMMGNVTPFELSVQFPTETRIGDMPTPSISAVLGDYEGRLHWYRPDFAINPATIETISYADLLFDRLDERRLAGRSVIIGYTDLLTSDLRNLPLGGKVPGVYFHVMGAHTLKNGLPLDLGWIPGLVFVIIIIVFQAKRKKPLPKLAWGGTLALLIAPLAFDYLAINIDSSAAILTLGIATFRLRRLSNQVYHKDTDLILAGAISSGEHSQAQDVYALKIENLGDLTESIEPKQFGTFIERIITCVQQASPSTGADTQVAFEKDTLLWFAQKLDRSELEANSLGLVSVLRNAMTYQGNWANLATTLGVDISYDLPVAQRVQNAIRAAENGTKTSRRFVISDEQFLDERRRYLELLAELNIGMKAETIGVAYQPKIRLANDTVAGAEALIRWHHPELGYVDPFELVTTAEEHDRINELTIYVLDRALGEAKEAVLIDPDFKLAVNFSAQALADEMILHHTPRLLKEHAFPSRNLIIEVTESARLDGKRVNSKIAELREHGISFSIDDFGTGHSSLDYLSRVPCQELKMDRKFVSGMQSSEDNANLVKGTIDMAHSLAKSVVAEGVEDAATANALRNIGCDLAQGYFYSPAISMADITKMIVKRRNAA
ncbi:EAL domain-containing protein [Alterisphingorhabdus coralli]|uniref:EAL domain-containing protein n=1 Tax=Alterisphingorhabdus coralli TaxID=3071408 RepID=A0AA97F9P9_9SPHN|nr:EAL domain-containing protein [Parasphingorhabdus sp. SCSIO 66989]WOE75070.1 EAL domain-containing protein [Parasphingorhabdus sp. SCSIO 66989]